MTVTLAAAGVPKLDPKVDVGVHIIKLPSRQAIVDRLGGHPSEAEVAAEAATLAGPAKPTDVVVFEGKPWHKVNGELRAHPKVHDDYAETILEVSFAARQRATWWSTEPFEITKVKPSDHHSAVAGAPKQPFEGPDPPYEAQPIPAAAGPGAIWVVQAQPIVERAIGQRYKITFRMAGSLIDPDMEGKA